MDRPPARLKGNRVYGLPADRDGGDYDSVLALRGCKGHGGRGARGPLTSHWNGFSPVCVLRCSSRPRFWLKALPHSEHVYGFSCRQWGHREPGDGARGAGRNPIPLTPPKVPPTAPHGEPTPCMASALATSNVPSTATRGDLLRRHGRRLCHAVSEHSVC